jgi:acyl-coenzyme A synthetase/AMP-(fatty) acid ligase/acyl carrier protein
MQLHQNVVRLFDATKEHFHFSDNDVWTLFHSISFDFSVWELWGSLLHGAKLVIPSRQTIEDPAAFVDLCEQHKVTVLNQTPNAFNAFAHSALLNKNPLEALKWVIFAGEALQFDRLQAWWDFYGEDQPVLVNMYGITETTVHASFKRLSVNDSEKASIGQRLADQRFYVLNDSLQPMPVGAVGQLYIGGAGLARGYLNQPDLTAQKFIQNPFSDNSFIGSSDARLYQTGDLVRYLANGELVYIGRIDGQVKVRGFRIELGEIEVQLSCCEGVVSCVVLLWNERLVAYVVGEQNLTTQTLSTKALAEQLQSTLPAHMLPSAFVVLDKMPLTANGKVDKKALPAPDGSHLQGLYVAPKSNSEKALVKIWADLFKLDEDKVSVTANFFEVGGHSLLAVRLVGQISEHLSQELSIKDIFESPTIRALAIVIDRAQTKAFVQTQQNQTEIKSEGYL